MAKATNELIDALRRVARKLEQGGAYQWGHMGSCNCGLLAQELTPFTKADIHRFAMQRCGDWTQQGNDYCPSSGYPLDMIITEMLKSGLDTEDLENLEKLSDPAVLKRLPGRALQHNDRMSVAMYFYAWVDLLEEKRLKEYEVEMQGALPELSR